ncbi:MAG: LysR family transcriptional regulator, partial [Gammaproteobacteria bacterium]
MQIERHEIRIFSAVVEEGGFSRAAERLNISQSAVSQAVANLEHKLDTQLLLREKQPELTEAGKRLFSFTQTVINEEHNTLQDIQQIRTGALS